MDNPIEVAQTIDRTYKASSPVPAQKEGEYVGEIDFFEAMRAVIDGERVTKAEWENTHKYIYLADEYLRIHKDNNVYNFTIRLPDMLGEDYIII